jgi:hypothetical protein
MTASFLNLELGFDLNNWCLVLFLLLLSLNFFWLLFRSRLLCCFPHNVLLLLLLVLLLFFLLLLFLLSILSLLLFSLFTLFTFLLFLLHALLFLLLPLTFSFLLLFLLCFLSFLLLPQSFLLSSGLIIISLSIIFIFLTLFPGNTKNLHNMGSCIDASSSCSKHLLKEKVSFLWLMTCNNFSWFAVNLLSNHKLSQLQQFD